MPQVESDLPASRKQSSDEARDRESLFEGRKILVVEDDVRNVFALSSILEPRGAVLRIARNGKQALAITAKAMADAREKCREAGMNDYISKPNDIDKLLSLLRVWLPR